MELTRQEIEAQSQTALERASALRITSQPKYLEAVDFRQTMKSFEKAVDDVFEPMRSKAYSAYKEVVAQRDKLKEPFTAAADKVTALCKTWEREEAERARQKEEKLAEERRALEAEQARKEAEARREAEEAERKAREASNAYAREKAEAARAALMAKQEQERLAMERAMNQNAKKAAAVDNRAHAAPVVYIDNWKVESVDLRALVKAAADNMALLGFLTYDEKMLNKIARETEGNAKIPGVTFVNDKYIRRK